MRNIEFINDHFYHIYNRGVLKNNIFTDSGDYARFIHYLYEFNCNSRKHNTRRNCGRMFEQNQNVRGRASNIGGALVDVICWCLMPNHFHLILRQRVENGIRKFIHKVETGHAMYFNKKYNRSGVFYEGRFKAILIEEDEYLAHLSRYIHLNPLDLIEPGWKENGIKNLKTVSRFLENYKWSSYLDYIGKYNFPSILNKEPMGWYFSSLEEHRKFIQGWLRTDTDTVEELVLE